MSMVNNKAKAKNELTTFSTKIIFFYPFLYFQHVFNAKKIQTKWVDELRITELCVIEAHFYGFIYV